MWKDAKETYQYETDAILKLSEHTFYFSGEILVVESRVASSVGAQSSTVPDVLSAGGSWGLYYIS